MTPAIHFNVKSIPTDRLIHNLGSVRLHMVQAADIRPDDSEETVSAQIVSFTIKFANSVLM